MPTASWADRRPLARKLTLALEGVVAELKTGTCDRPFRLMELSSAREEVKNSMNRHAGQGISAEPRPFSFQACYHTSGESLFPPVMHTHIPAEAEIRYHVNDAARMALR